MRNSHQLIQAILAALFTAEHRRLEGELQRLHQANKNAWAKLADGFVFQGQFFIPKDVPNGPRTNLPLHERLWGEAKEFLADRKLIEDDGQNISQLMFKLLEPCGLTGHLDQDIRDAVPECIQDLLSEEIRALSRIRPAKEMLHHPRDWKLYDQVHPRIEFYSAARLLY